MDLGAQAAIGFPFADLRGPPEGLHRAVNHDGGLAVARGVHRVFQEGVGCLVKAQIIDHHIVSLGELGVGQSVEIERRRELRVQELAQTGGQVRRKFFVVVIAAAGKKQSFQRRHGGGRRLGGAGGDTPNLDVAQRPGGLPGGQAKRFGQVDVAGPQRNFATRDGLVHNLFVINPRLDLFLDDSQPKSMPATGIKFHIFGRFVFRCVQAVNARQSDDAAAPAADNERAKRVLDRKRQATEEVAAINLHGLERHFVVDLRQRVGPTHAGEHHAGMKHEPAVFHIHLAVSGKVGDLPSFERLPVEQALPLVSPARDGTHRKQQRASKH